MAIAKTFTITVQSTGGGNKYFVDGIQQDTIMIGAGLLISLINQILQMVVTL